MKIRSFVRKTVRVLLVLGLAGCLVMFLVNLYMIRKEKKYILTADQAGELEDVDCIMVLGCGVRPDGTPSGMLSDRLDQGIRLYDEHVSDKLLMSGDHGKVNYDEVNLMKQFAIDRAVPSENIFMDHAGFSTYESMYRARDIFQVKKIVIVTQRYHMYRALYVAQSMGMEAYGVASDPRTYGGQRMRDVRELLARPKDLIYTIVMPKPTYLGDSIPVSGDGNVTNDKDENRKRAVSATAVPQENE
ncbi:SanA/YdcF family protein [Enterocloster citroniae]